MLGKTLLLRYISNPELLSCQYICYYFKLLQFISTLDSIKCIFIYVCKYVCLWTIIKTAHEFITTKNFNSVSYWPSLSHSFSISCMWMQAHTWTHICMWRPEFDVKNHPRPSFYLFTEPGTLSQTQSSLIWPVLIISLPGINCLCLLRLEPQVGY